MLFRSGNHSATEFVGWYSGHPDFVGHTFGLSGGRAVVIGNGGVALDIALPQLPSVATGPLVNSRMTWAAISGHGRPVGHEPCTISPGLSHRRVRAPRRPLHIDPRLARPYAAGARLMTRHLLVEVELGSVRIADVHGGAVTIIDDVDSVSDSGLYGDLGETDALHLTGDAFAPAPTHLRDPSG